MNTNLKNLSRNFRKEEKELLAIGINKWEMIVKLSDNEILNLVKRKYCSHRNLRRIRCIAKLICELNLSQDLAALLMHSGISSVKAITDLNPQEIIKKTGRFERLVRTGREPVMNLEKASKLIKRAKQARNNSCSPALHLE